MFKSWSENNTAAQKTLKPDLGLRQWDSLSDDEKILIWRHLESYFFNIDKFEYDQYDHNHEYTNLSGDYYLFYDPYAGEKRERIDRSIATINKKYKTKNYAKNFIKTHSHFSACMDFHFVFAKAEGDAVLELLSYYCRGILVEREVFYRKKNENESLEEFESEKEKWHYAEFDKFAEDLNEVFTDFGLNVYLSRNGFIPKQDDKITKKIFEPVLQSLKDTKWKEINRLLSDAFFEYTKNTPNGYSTCVTHTVAAVEAFLQIIVKGKAGEGDFAGLISEGQRKGLVPEDFFTREMFKIIVSVLMKERKETGDSHVKKSYATEKNAKMVLNLSMIFIQHCLVK